MRKSLLRQPHRDRYDIVNDILSIVSNTQSIYRSQRHQTSIGYAADLTHPQTVRYLKGLRQKIIKYTAKRETITSLNQPIDRIAIIGTGLIGASNSANATDRR